MFRDIRYQTGEMNEIIHEMENGKIPCMDVDDNDELNWFIKELEKRDILVADEIPYDKNARDRIKEPEFEFRIAFRKQGDNKLLYIDFYFEPIEEETYDSIFGD